MVLALLAPLAVWLPAKPAHAVTPTGDGQVKIGEQYQPSVETLGDYRTKKYFTVKSAGHWWFAGGPDALCSLPATDGLAGLLEVNGWSGTGAMPCGSTPPAGSELRQTATGMLLIPEGTTSLTVRAENAPVDGEERKAWFAFWSAEGPDLAGMVERGYGTTAYLVPEAIDVPVPIPTACANPHAIAFRVYVFDNNRTYGYKLSWSLDGGAFVDIPQSAFSTIGGTEFVDANSNGLEDYKEEDFDGDGITDWLEMNSSLVEIDTDLDGQPDCADTDSDNDANPDATDPNRVVPTAVDDAATVVAGQSVVIADVVGNDDFPSPTSNSDIEVTALATGSADPADFTLTTAGELTYNSDTADEDASPVTVDYRVCNTAVTPNACGEATITITATDEGAPSPADDSATTADDLTTLTIDWAGNDDLTDFEQVDAVESIDTTGTQGTVVDNEDGTFDFTPTAGFGGDTTFDYTICDNDPTPNCASATVTVTVPATPRVGIAKRFVAPAAPNDDGSFTIEYDLVVEALGNEDLESVTVTDQLPSLNSVTDISVTTAAGITASTTFDGDTDLVVAAPFDLAAGASTTLTISITYTPGTPASPSNQARVAATGSISGSDTSDHSDDGTDPDPNGNHIPDEAGEDDPTVFDEASDLPWDAELTVTKTALGSAAGAGGEFTTTFRITVENTGNESVDNIEITDTLSGFPGLDSPAVTSTSVGTANTGWDGALDTALLDAAISLDPGAVATIEVDATYTPSAAGTATNTATASGEGRHLGTAADDTDTAPVDFGADLPLTRTYDVTKTVTDQTYVGDGKFKIGYTVAVTYSGTEPVTVSITDDVAANFPAGFAAEATSASGELSANSGFDGTGDTLLNTPTTLAPGESGSVTYEVTFVPDSLDPIINTARVGATGSISGITTPGNDSATLSVAGFNITPQVNVDKQAGAVIDNGDGTFSITWTIDVDNLGREALDVQVADDLASIFPTGYVVSGLGATGALDVDNAFDGDTMTNLLLASSRLAAEASASIEYTVTWTPTTTDPITNTAAATAIGAVSGDPDDDTASATSAAPIIDPDINFTMSAASLPTSVGDTVEYTFVVTNTGNVAVSAVTIDDLQCAATPTLISGDTDGDSVLDVGESWTLTCTSDLVTQAEVDAGAFINTATASGTPALGSLDSVTRTINQPISPDPEFTLVKAAQTAPTTAGETITYSFTVVNTGNVSISALDIDDPKCETAAAISTESGAADGILVAAETQVWTCTSIAVTQAEVDAGEVNNSATLSGTPAGGILAPVSDDHTTSIVRAPNWTLIKATSSAPTDAGDTLDYTFTIVNTGNVTIGGVEVTDTRCGSGPTISGAPGETNLSVGETQTWTCTSIPVTQTEVDVGVVNNSATATATTPSGTALSISDTATTPIPASPSWTVDKSTDSVPTRAGQQLHYIFDIENTGNVTITSPTLTDDKCSAAPTFVSGDDNANSAVDPDEVWQYDCQSEPITQAQVDAGHVDNTVSVAGTAARGTLPTATDTVSTPILAHPDWEVVKSTSSSAATAGDSLNYTFSLVNKGNVTIGNLAVTDLKCATTPTIDTETSHADGELEAGETQVWSCTSVPVTQGEIDAGEILNNVSVSGRPSGGSLAPATDSHTLTVVRSPDWQVTKSALNGASVAGDTIDYKFTVVNTGNVTISGITIDDPRCAEEPVPQPGPLGPDSSLGPGLAETWICTSIPVTQAEVDAGRVDNSMTVSGTPAGGLLDDAGDDHTVTVSANPSWSLAKSALSGANQAGDTIDYEIDITNTGNVTIADPVVVDPKCAVAPAYDSGDTDGDGQLDVDETWVYLCTSVPITQTEVDSGAALNTATATGSAARGTLPPASGTVSSPIEAHPEWEVTKAGLSTPEEENDTMDYKFNVVNTGNVTITDVVVDDLKCAAAPTIHSESIHDDLALEAGETQIWTCTSIPVTQAEIDAGDIHNDVTVTGTPANGSIDPATDSHIARIDPHPEVQISMATTSTASQAGDTLLFKFTVINIGNVTLSDPFVTESQCDALPQLVSESIHDDGVLEHGETQVWTCTSHAITQAEVDVGSITDVATVTGTPPTGPDVSATTSLTVQILASPHWTMAKSALSSPSAAGDTILYHFDVSNDGAITIYDPAIVDDKCGETPFVVGGDDDDDGELDVDETWIFECNSIAVTQAEIDVGHVDNAAEAVATPARGTLNQAADELSVAVSTTPSLRVIKAADNAVGAAGETIDYTFTLTNNGNVTIREKAIDDPKCATDPTLELETVADPDHYLSPGETQIWRCTSIPVTQAEIDVGHVDNTATITGTPWAGSLDPVVVEHTLAVTAEPGLAAIKSARTTALAAGDTIEYSFTVISTGNVSLIDPQVSDPKCSAAPTVESESINVDGVLEPGETKIWTCLSIPVTQEEVDAGWVNNVAVASASPVGGTLDPVEMSATSSIPPQADWTFTKVASGAVSAAGATLDYLFEVANVGTVTIETVDIADAKCASGPDLNAGDLDLDGRLDVGETWQLGCTSIPVTQAEADAGEVFNEATLTGLAARGILDDRTASTTTPIAARPSFEAVKAATTTVGGAGDTPSYAVTVVNTGNVTLTDVTVTDDKCATAPILDAESMAQDGVLSPGESHVWACTTVPVTQAEVDSGLVENTATVSTTAPTGPLPAVTVDHVTAVAADASVAMTKASASEPTRAGAVVDYSFTVVNDGNVTISGGAVVDDKCASGPTLVSESIVEDGLLATGETWILECGSVPVTQAEVDAGEVFNEAAFVGFAPGGSAVETTALNRIAIPANPSWVLDKTSTSAATRAGETLDYRFEVTNTGNVSISDVSIADAKCAAAPNLVSESGADDRVLAPGETQTWACTSIPATQQEVDAGAVDNAASVAGTPSRGVLPLGYADVRSEVSPEPGVELVKRLGSINDVDGDGEIAVGDTVSWTFSVTNTGNVTLFDLSIADSGATVADATLGSLAPGDSWTSATAVTVIDEQDLEVGFVENEADVSARTPGGETITEGSRPPDGAVSKPTQVEIDTPEAKVGAAKQVTFGPEATDRGMAIGFEILVRNMGAGRLDDVQIDEDLAASFPGQVFFVDSVTSDSANCPINASFDGSTDTSMLAPGASVEPGADCTVELTVTVVTDGHFVGSNQVTVTGESFGKRTSDVSAPGSDPDPNGDGNPDEHDATSVVIALAAKPDAALDQPYGEPVTLEPLANDGDGEALTDLGLLDPTTGAVVLELVVPGEGVWRVDASTQRVTFSPEAGFFGAAAPVGYRANVGSSTQTVSATITVSFAPAPAPVPWLAPRELPDPPIADATAPSDPSDAGLSDAGLSEPDPGEPGDEPADALAYTGSRSSTLAVLSLMLIGLGVALVRFGTRTDD